MNNRRMDLGEYCVISIWFGCNNKCGICMLSNVKDTLPAVGFNRYTMAINDIKRDGRFKNLILSGAEVTTFEDLDKYVECATSLEWFKKIQIQTNGRRLSDPRYLDHLIHCGVNEFFVSIHGFEETHDRATGIPGAFKETLSGLRHLSGCNVNVISNTVLTRNNFPELQRFVRFLCGECVSEIHLWNYFPMESTDSRNLLVRFADLISILEELQDIAQAAGKVIVLKSFPLCLYAGPPVFFDSVFPVTVLPDLFWKEFSKSGFGKCVYRETGACNTVECWGLCSAYLNKFGDERNLLRPIS
jgi:cyclic pyranopterin phosphate synthase